MSCFDTTSEPLAWIPSNDLINNTNYDRVSKSIESLFGNDSIAELERKIAENVCKDTDLLDVDNLIDSIRGQNEQFNNSNIINENSSRPVYRPILAQFCPSQRNGLNRINQEQSVHQFRNSNTFSSPKHFMGNNLFQDTDINNLSSFKFGYNDWDKEKFGESEVLIDVPDYLSSGQHLSSTQETHVGPNCLQLSSTQQTHVDPNCLELSSTQQTHVDPNCLELFSTQQTHVDSNSLEPSSTQESHLDLNSLEPSSTEEIYLDPNSLEYSTLEALCWVNFLEPSSTQQTHVDPNWLELSSTQQTHVDPSCLELSSTQQTHVDPNSLELSSTQQTHVDPNSLEPSSTQEIYLDSNSLEPSSTQATHYWPNNVGPSTQETHCLINFLEPSSAEDAQFWLNHLEPSSTQETSVAAESIPAVKKTSLGGARHITRNQKLDFDNQRVFKRHHDFRNLLTLECPKSKNMHCEINYRGYTGENCVEIASGIRPNDYVNHNFPATLLEWRKTSTQEEAEEMRLLNGMLSKSKKHQDRIEEMQTRMTFFSNATKRTKYSRDLVRLEGSVSNISYERNELFGINQPSEPEWFRVESNLTGAQQTSTRCGICPYCKPINCLNLKSGGYAKHLAKAHGISKSNYIFPEALNYGQYQMIINANKKQNSVECPECHEILKVGKTKTSTNYFTHWQENHNHISGY